MKHEVYKMIASLQRLGFNYEEANALRRISRTLQHWFELECGTANEAGTNFSIERDDNGEGKPFRRVQYMAAGGQWIDARYPIADREASARKRLAKIMAAHGGLVYYVQTDPRGAALYILRKADVAGENIDSIYNRGVAVY